MKLATFFVRATDVPGSLTDWMDVNPRVPVLNRKEKMSGRVARAMLDTLQEEPELFVLKNQGIWLLADSVEFQKEEGGGGVARVTLSDRDAHGVVNGGHTLRAILQAQDDVDEDVLRGAFVRLHVLQGIQGAIVTELAEGLNRSLQVDNPSLANLSGAFDSIKAEMAGKPGQGQIAYRQGDEGDVDILDVLTIALMFDLNRFPDRKKHPNVLFGQPKAVLVEFQEDVANKSFTILLPKLHEILALSDRVKQAAFEKCGSRLGKIKISTAKSGNRAASPKNKGIPAHFAGGTVGGKIPQGFLYPMLAAFREPSATPG
jgi:hypothetical protein